MFAFVFLTSGVSSSLNDSSSSRTSKSSSVRSTNLLHSGSARYGIRLSSHIEHEMDKGSWVMPPLEQQCDETHVSRFIQQACEYVEKNGLGKQGRRD